MLISISSFPVTKQDIVKASREDVEKAVKLLKIYIAEHPQENIENLGKMIFVKKKLSSDPDIGDAVVKEDFNALLEGLIRKGSVSKELFEDLKVIFNFKDELEKRLEDLDENAIKVCNMVGSFLKVGCRNIARSLVERYMKDPLKFDPKPYMTLSCINEQELKKAISGVLEEKFEEGEKNYMEVWALSKMLDIDFPHSREVDSYVSLSMDIDEALKTGASSETYVELKKRFDSLHSSKEDLRRKLENLNEMISATSQAEKRGSPEKKPIAVYVAVTVVSAAVFFLILMLVDSRHIVKRLKKRIERDPLNPDLHIKLAEIYEKIGRLEDAMEEYKIASKLSSKKDEGKKEN